MIKVCAIILAYGLAPKLPQVVESVKDVPTYILHPVRSWWSDEMDDKVPEIARELGVSLANIHAKDETDARNQSVSLAKAMGYDFAILLDSDEVLEGTDLLIDYLERSDSTDSYVCRILDYGFDDITVLPERNHRPLVAIGTDVDTSEHYFYDKRCFHGTLKEVPSDIVIHHYSLSNIKEHRFKEASDKYDDAWPPTEYSEYYNNNGKMEV